MNKLFENWRKHVNEGGAQGHYEPGRAVADIGSSQEYASRDEITQEKVTHLADKFNVEAFVETASDGKTAILVFHQNGEPAAYNDTEEMYTALADSQEIGEGLENVTPENIQIVVEAIKQVAMNFAPAIVLPALAIAYKELKMNKANKES